jgi:rRNA processing protein Krr1/Pno1
MVKPPPKRDPAIEAIVRRVGRMIGTPPQTKRAVKKFTSKKARKGAK